MLALSSRAAHERSAGAQELWASWKIIDAGQKLLQFGVPCYRLLQLLCLAINVPVECVSRQKCRMSVKAAAKSYSSEGGCLTLGWACVEFCGDILGGGHHNTRI